MIARTLLPEIHSRFFPNGVVSKLAGLSVVLAKESIECLDPTADTALIRLYDVFRTREQDDIFHLLTCQVLDDPFLNWKSRGHTVMQVVVFRSAWTIGQKVKHDVVDKDTVVSGKTYEYWPTLWNLLLHE